MWNIILVSTNEYFRDIQIPKCSLELICHIIFQQSLAENVFYFCFKILEKYVSFINIHFFTNNTADIQSELLFYLNSLEVTISENISAHVVWFTLPSYVLIIFKNISSQ